MTGVRRSYKHNNDARNKVSRRMKYSLKIRKKNKKIVHEQSRTNKTTNNTINIPNTKYRSHKRHRWR